MKPSKIAEEAAKKLNKKLVRIIFDIIEWDTKLSAKYMRTLSAMRGATTERTLNAAINMAVEDLYRLRSVGVGPAALIKTHSQFAAGN